MEIIEAVAGGTVADGEENDEKDYLCLFGNIIFVDIFYVFLENTPLRAFDDIEDESVMQTARIDAWVETVLTCLEQRERVGAHFHKSCEEGTKPAYRTGL